MSSRDDIVGANSRQATEASGLYVDMENLQQADGQRMVESLMENWPDQAPSPSRLALFVRADHVELWRLWASSRFPDLEVVAHGTQHFSMSSSKNSADIAIATNAMADLLAKRVTHVVVMSDDSDFISLFVAIRDEPSIPTADDAVPFLWVVTNREGSVSATVKQFFPPDMLHVIGTERREPGTGGDSKPPPLGTIEFPSNKSKGTWPELADVVVSDIPVGPFKSTDCQPIIRKYWPDHATAKAGGAEFGSQFKNNVWPILERRGVRIDNPGRKPIRYEMTAEAKATL